MAGLSGIRLQKMHDCEEGLAVFLDLGPLVSVAGILHGEFVQVELFTHFVQLSRRRIGQGHPDKAVNHASQRHELTH